MIVKATAILGEGDMMVLDTEKTAINLCKFSESHDSLDMRGKT